MTTPEAGATIPRSLKPGRSTTAPGTRIVSLDHAERLFEGDDLRDAKFYMDALDYYRAAMGKAGETALLHNKSGIALLQLMRFDQASIGEWLWLRQLLRPLPVGTVVGLADEHDSSSRPQ